MTASPADLFGRRPLAAVTMACPHCGGSGQIEAATMGQRVKALRMARGLTPPQLAEMCGGAISSGNINQIERETNNNPSVQAVAALAAVFGCKVGYIIAGES